jgi:large-conductance mechanosensitive channel
MCTGKSWGNSAITSELNLTPRTQRRVALVFIIIPPMSEVLRYRKMKKIFLNFFVYFFLISSSFLCIIGYSQNRKHKGNIAEQEIEQLKTDEKLEKEIKSIVRLRIDEYVKNTPNIGEIKTKRKNIRDEFNLRKEQCEREFSNKYERALS